MRMCVCLSACSNCHKGLSEDAACHGHHSSVSVRRERERVRETERLWRSPHLTSTRLAVHCLLAVEGSFSYSVLCCQRMGVEAGGQIEGRRKGRMRKQMKGKREGEDQ